MTNSKLIICIVIGRAKRAPHWGVQISRDIYPFVCLRGGITWPKQRMLKVCLGRLKPTCGTHVNHLDCTLEQL